MWAPLPAAHKPQALSQLQSPAQERTKTDFLSDALNQTANSTPPTGANDQAAQLHVGFANRLRRRPHRRRSPVFTRGFGPPQLVKRPLSRMRPTEPSRPHQPSLPADSIARPLAGAIENRINPEFSYACGMTTFCSSASSSASQVGGEIRKTSPNRVRSRREFSGRTALVG